MIGHQTLVNGFARWIGFTEDLDANCQIEVTTFVQLSVLERRRNTISLFSAPTKSCDGTFGEAILCSMSFICGQADLIEDHPRKRNDEKLDPYDRGRSCVDSVD